MAHQDISSKLKEDQPPAYPYNDKPPDYHDVCPRKTVSPPPVDILPPDNTPAVHIPLSTTTTATSSVVESSDTTTTTSIAAATTTTRYPPENIVVTQPLSHNSHLNNVNNIESRNQIDCFDREYCGVLWIILLVASVIATIICLPVGVNALVFACYGYFGKNPDDKAVAAIVAAFLCVIVYGSVTIVVIVVPIATA